MEDIRVLKLGLGEIVSNWGTHNGIPCVFLEPALNGAGVSGERVISSKEPQITQDGLSSGAVIIEIHNEKGIDVLIDDLRRAIRAFNEAHPEPLKCSDCILIHGKSTCIMNCGPSRPHNPVRNTERNFQ